MDQSEIILACQRGLYIARISFTDQDSQVINKDTKSKSILSKYMSKLPFFD